MTEPREALLAVDDDDGRTFTLLVRGLDRATFDDLLHAHASGDGDEQPWVMDALAPALISACAVEPRLTPGDAAMIWHSWSHGDSAALFDRCLALCLPDEAKGFERSWLRLDREEGLRAEMGYCGPAGLPHSQFLGGPAVWTDTDRELALAWDAMRRATCPRCGTRHDQWARDPDAFVVAQSRDRGCELLEEAEREMEKVPLEQRRGIHSYLEPRAVADARDAVREAAQRAGG